MFFGAVNGLGYSDGQPPVADILRVLLSRDLNSRAPDPNALNVSSANGPTQSEPTRAVTPPGQSTLRPTPAALMSCLPVIEDVPPSIVDNFGRTDLVQRQPVGVTVGSGSSEFVFNRMGAHHDLQSQRYDNVTTGDSPVSELGGTVDAVSCIRHVGTETGQADDEGDDDQDDEFHSMIPVVDELRRKIGTESRKAKILGDVHGDAKRLAAATNPVAVLQFEDDDKCGVIPLSRAPGEHHLIQQAREDMAFALHQIRQQVEMLALIAAEREVELQSVIQSLQSGAASKNSGNPARRKSGGVINVHVVRDYDEPVVAYAKRAGLSQQNSMLVFQQSAKNNRTSSALYSATNYSSDWTQAVDRSRSINEEVRTAYDST